jgi:hypothetical protein
MSISPSNRRLTLALTLALSLGVLVVALLGPAQTLAQAGRTTCSTTVTHAKPKRAAHACTQASSRGKAKTRHESKRRKHARAKKKTKDGAAGTATMPASCEDASAPVAAPGGGFSCEDGSEPQCEDGATPTPSRNGKVLLCPISGAGEATTGEGEGEGECEEEALACEPGAAAGNDEQSCEAPAGDGSDLACEAAS